jgi:signal transduction histidine kinase
VYLTAYADDRTLARAKATEAFGYLLKPFGERELQVAIEMALYKHSLERKLRSYAADLEARNRELDAYAHTVAHDLKHPLTMILGFTNMLAGGLTAMSDEELDLCTRRIAASVQKMANVIDELLLLSEVRTGNAEMSRVDMARVVDAAQKRLAALIERRQAQISGPRSWPSALGYAPWVEEVWVNYLSNAIKYGGDPPQVELGTDVDQKAGPSNGTVQFWVRDNGPGLTEEEQSRLFTPFTRLDQVRAQGHGLGLSIVQRIVERLGGEVGVESQVGEGSTFYFKLKTC